MKLSQYAKNKGISYRTAWEWFNKGLIPNAKQFPTGTIIVEENQTSTTKNDNIVIYARVSSPSRKNELQYQVNRCEEFCSARGMVIHKVYKEVASGMNDKRRELLRMLEENPTTIVVENKDRLTRFGFNYLETLLNKLGTKIIVINHVNEDEKDLIHDMISIVTSFCCRLYGLRRGKAKAKEIKNIVT